MAIVTPPNASRTIPSTPAISLVDRMPFIGAAAAAGGLVGGGFLGAPGFFAGFVLGTLVAYLAPDAPKKA